MIKGWVLFGLVDKGDGVDVSIVISDFKISKFVF